MVESPIGARASEARLDFIEDQQDVVSRVGSPLVAQEADDGHSVYMTIVARKPE